MGCSRETSRGGDYLAKTVASQLAESSERGDREENAISELYAVMQKVMAELEQNEDTDIQPRNEIAPTNGKTSGGKSEHKRGCEEELAQSCTNTRGRPSKRRLRRRRSFYVNLT